MLLLSFNDFNNCNAHVCFQSPGRGCCAILHFKKKKKAERNVAADVQEIGMFCVIRVGKISSRFSFSLTLSFPNRKKNK